MRRKRIDELDRKIIRRLRNNCLTPFVRIAAELGVAEGTIRQRVKKLRALGVIRRFTVSVDPVIIGVGMVAFVLITVLPGHLPAAARAISSLQNVLEVHEIHTYGDLLVKIRAGNLNEVGEILSRQVKIIPGVVGSQVISVLNVWKDESGEYHRE